jgi:hypothetical protein
MEEEDLYMSEHKFIGTIVYLNLEAVCVDKLETLPGLRILNYLLLPEILKTISWRNALPL